MKKRRTYTSITAKIIFLSLSLTLISAYLYSGYIKKVAIENLSQVDAKKTSKLVFESLYSAMKRGWTKDDLNEIITRLNTIDKDMKIVVYRSKLVAELFGEIQEDKKQRENNELVKKAMIGEELLDIDNDDFIKYHYPVTAKNECLKCHINAKTGDVLGVIGVSSPIEDLKISLDRMINFFILFIVIFSFIIFIGIFIKFNKYLIKPIKKISVATKHIIKTNDISKRIDVDDNNIEEIALIKDAFNSMLDSLERQFYYDSLTGLKNKRQLMANLEKQKNSFLLIINIDAFREINDLYGEQTGDIVLKEFVLLLQEIVPQKDMLYRLHSDEFAYLSQDTMTLHECENFVKMINEKIVQKSFQIGDNGNVNITTTIGITYGNSLLSNADIALKSAKKHKKPYLFYNSSMKTVKDYKKNFQWSKRLKEAIENNKIVAVFQPIVDTKTQKVSKYEALIRMADEKGNLIAPIHFLKLAKKNKLYHQLTKIMIEKTFKKFKDLSYSVSINISVEDILNKEIYTFILKKLEQSKMGSRIGFEILESEGIENFDEVLKFINDVKKYGASISIDDFGTGYSNFEYLMKLKVDYIKIDGSMIKNIDKNKDSQIITQTIVEFAKRMNIQTIAEFVHSKNVFEKVKELNVDFSQGYYFGEPTTEVIDIQS